MSTKATVNTKVKRGPESWAYIYVALGFALAIGGTIIQMITPLIFPWNLIAYALFATFTVWLFINNAWFQNKLIGMKMRYEEKSR